MMPEDQKRTAAIEAEKRADALTYALSVIEAYEREIRAAGSRIPSGFCQGVIFADARPTIRRMAGK